MQDSLKIIENSFQLLKRYCEKEEFKGWDPFDGLNSRLFKFTPLKYSRFLRLAWIQFFKKSPINFRKSALVPKDYNPKAMGLFLTGYCNLFKISPEPEYKKKIDFFIEKIIERQSSGWSGSCWGYNFDWQARAFFHPANTPTVVSTSFIACSMLDAYEITGEKSLLEKTRSSCDFILNDLHRTYDADGNFSFSYSPLDKSQIFNASFLGAKLLARVYSFTKEKQLADIAKKAVQYCVNRQKNDGSWVYGTLHHHQWIDNFHTGYNLECLSEYMKFTGDNEYEKNIITGTRFYLNNLFTEEGIPKYYYNSVFPVDIHAPAQLIATLFRLGLLKNEEKLVRKVLLWTIQNMQSREKGYFYYQKNKWSINKIPYMRWSQAWMFYAFTFYFREFRHQLQTDGTQT